MELPNVPLHNGQAAFEPLAWRWRRICCGVFSAVMWLSVMGVLISFSITAAHPYKKTFLMIGTACYLAVALLGGALRWNYGRLMFLGLICCALGDYLGLRNFVWGALAFLVAHVFFVAAFWITGIDWRRALHFAPIMLVVGVAILAWLFPGISRSDMLLVLGYMVIISLMVIFAYAINSPHRRPMIFLAAVIFYVSDIFVARWRFTETGSINGYFCYPMYYTACVLFAWTTCLYYQGREAQEPRAAK